MLLSQACSEVLIARQDTAHCNVLPVEVQTVLQHLCDMPQLGGVGDRVTEWAVGRLHAVDEVVCSLLLSTVQINCREINNGCAVFLIH